MVYLQINFAKIYGVDLILDSKTNKNINIVLRDIITEEMRRTWSGKKVSPYYNKKNKRSYWNIESSRAIVLLRHWKKFGFRGFATGVIFRFDGEAKKYVPIIRLENDILVFLKHKIDMNGNIMIIDDLTFNIFDYAKQISNGQILTIYKNMKWKWDI